MKALTIAGLVAGIAAVSAGIYTAIDTGSQSPIILAGKVRLAPELVESAKGIRTLYLVVHDPNSPMPMPFGAVRETLAEDAKAGEFFDFFITKEKLQMMNPQAPYPLTMRLKVRLDRDGLGGTDQPGDLRGEATSLPIGQQGVVVEIKELVPGG